MRKIKTHVVEGDTLNHQLTIEVLDEPEPGGANHEYRIVGPTEHTVWKTLRFQNGPIAESGVNGISNEALLAIVMDRLDGFQKGSFACDENDEAYNCIHEALLTLQRRTRDRLARGVEGTLQK